MEVKRFLIGSRAIFAGYKDFDSITTDTDILIIDDDPDFDIETSLKNTEDGMHYIKWPQMSKEDLLKFHSVCYRGTISQKFLVPEYVEYIGFTIEDLKQLRRLTDHLDDKHTYEKVVYDAYIENNGFFLTDEQKEAAYQEYKRKRV